jgi:endonuclease/exonuclease/phosphatase (EEP) superfamily protein YafD
MPSRHLEWAVAGALTGWAAVRLTGADRLSFAETWTVPAISFTPQVAAGAWAGALMLRGKAPAATAAVAAAALTATVLPRTIPSRQPAATGPVLRVLTANLLAGRAVAAEVVELAARKRADVLFVQELTEAAVTSLQQAGLTDLLTHQVLQPIPRGSAGTAIYARYPLSAGPAIAPGSAARCTARLDFPSGQYAELICVHPKPPRPPWPPYGPARSPSAAARWRTQLSALLPPGDGPHILAGDFNATLDHAQFRRLLRLGYADTARQVGNGLELTWGLRPGRRPALLAIDHVLADRRCAVLATSAHRLTGSDHRALYAELRLSASSSAT